MDLPALGLAQKFSNDFPVEAEKNRLGDELDTEFFLYSISNFSGQAQYVFGRGAAFVDKSQSMLG